MTELLIGCRLFMIISWTRLHSIVVWYLEDALDGQGSYHLTCVGYMPSGGLLSHTLSIKKTKIAPAVASIRPTGYLAHCMYYISGFHHSNSILWLNDISEPSEDLTRAVSGVQSTGVSFEHLRNPLPGNEALVSNFSPPSWSSYIRAKCANNCSSRQRKSVFASTDIDGQHFV